jgi:hypothetical protein
MTCDARTHTYVVAGGRCMHCGEVLQASGPLVGQYGPPGLVWKAAPFLDATVHARCRHAPAGRHETRDASGMCAHCGTQLEALGDIEVPGRRSRLMWFEMPTPGTGWPNT